ncbi:MAG: Gfo/Idh/MocA family oxidoreductase [Nitrospiraceae bacterium]
MGPLQVGVLGVGHLGQHHARLYASLPETRLAGIYDTDPVRAASIAERHGCPVFDDPGRLIAASQAVSVAVPTTAHYDLAKRCLDAGRHVLVEKPIAVTVAEAQELVAVAHAKGCVLQVGHSERFNPIMLAVRGELGRPAFIEAQRLAPFNVRGTDVDVILDLMIHDLDLVLSMARSPVQSVQAEGASVLSSRIDLAHARLQFADGSVALLTASRVSATRLRRLRVYQESGSVAVDLHARHATVTKRVPGSERPSLEMRTIAGSDEEPLKLQLQSFADAIVAGRQAVVSGEAGTAALALAHRIRDAIGVYWDGLEANGFLHGQPRPSL